MAWAPVLACLGSFLGCGIWLRIASRRVLDVPGARSLHALPTPTSGGIGILAGLLLAGAALRAGSALDESWCLVLLLACGLSLLGFADDRRGLSVGFRLIAQLMAAVILLASLWPEIHGSGRAVFLLPVCLLWLVGFTNLFNFMDGIDGFAAVQAVFAGATAAVLASLQGASHDAVLLLAALAAAALGFLPWNWPVARLFMGDAGSLLLGFLFAASGLLSVLRADLSWVVWLILWLPFVVDGTLTLLRRALQKKPLTNSHREHAYQRYALGSGSHRHVTLALLALDVFWLLPYAFLAVLFPDQAGSLLLVAALPCFLIFIRSPPDIRAD